MNDQPPPGTAGWQVEAGFIRKTYPHKVAPECSCEIGSTCLHRPCCYYGETVPKNVRSTLEPSSVSPGTAASVGIYRGRDIPEFIDRRGARHIYVGVAVEDRDGTVPLSQLAPDELVIAPGLIYRKVT